MNTTEIIALIAAVLSAASIALHIIAPRTKTTVDDGWRDGVDEALAFLRGATPPAPASPPKEAP